MNLRIRPFKIVAFDQKYSSDFKATLKHKTKEMLLEDLILRIYVEADVRNQDKGKPPYMLRLTYLSKVGR